MDRSPNISVVIPVYNEAPNLDELLRRCLDTLRRTGRAFELIFIDDGSVDGSPERLRDAARLQPEVVAVLLNHNFGQHSAVMAGFAESRGEVIITLDADLQNPPEEMTKLLAAMDEGYDVVGSIRTPRQDSLFRRFASHIVNRIVQRSTRIMMTDYGCMLRAYRRPVIDAILRCPERSTFIPVLANSFANRTTEVEVAHAARRDGDSKYNLRRLIALQFDMLTSMTTFPIRVLTMVGGIMSMLGIGFAAFLLAARLAFGSEWAAQGVFTLFAVLFIFIGAQFIGLGLLGEYVGRIYIDVRGRPRYVVREVVGARDGRTETVPLQPHRATDRNFTRGEA